MSCDLTGLTNEANIIRKGGGFGFLRHTHYDSRPNHFQVSDYEDMDNLFNCFNWKALQLPLYLQARTLQLGTFKSVLTGLVLFCFTLKNLSLFFYLFVKLL